MDVFGKEIERIRVKRNFTQLEFSDILGVGRASYNKIASGQVGSKSAFIPKMISHTLFSNVEKLELIEAWNKLKENERLASFTREEYAPGAGALPPVGKRIRHMPDFYKKLNALGDSLRFIDPNDERLQDIRLMLGADPIISEQSQYMKVYNEQADPTPFVKPRFFMSNVYQLFRGGEFITSGTITELSEELDVQPKTIYNYATESYLERQKHNNACLKRYIVEEGELE